MRHVTDGELHAYLDGGLDALPREDAERIREHIDRCVHCSDRLAEQAALSARVSEILSLTDPGPIVGPPVEELKRLAQVAERHPGEEKGAAPRRWLRRSGWAASVAVAVSAGWWAGQDRTGSEAIVEVAPQGTGTAQGLPSPSVRMAEVVQGNSPSVQASDSEAEEVGPSARPERDEFRVALAGTEDTNTPDPQRSRVALQGETQTEPPVPVVLPAAPDERLTLPPLQQVSPQLVATAENLRSLEPNGPLRSSDFEGAEATDSPRVQLRWSGGPFLDSVSGGSGIDVVTSTAQTSDGLARGPRNEGTTRPDSAVPIRTEAELKIPGLEVVSIEWERLAPGVFGPKVIQRLDGGGSIELLFGGLVGESDGRIPVEVESAELPAGVNQVERALQLGWVVARAPLPPAQIRALLATIR